MGSVKTVAAAKSPQKLWLAAAILLALSALIRIAAMQGDLEIDEVWSWLFASAMQRPIDVLALRHDNNHPLNTLLMYAIGPDAAGVWYRIPAVLASTFTVATAGILALRRSPANALTAMLVFGGSYLMILYGSEARGYAYALCFALICWELLQRTADGQSGLAPAGAAIAGCLGLLAHLTFIYALAGCWAWAVLLWRKQPVWRVMLALMLPTLFAGLLFATFIREMEIGGGPEEETLFLAIVQSLSVAVGGPLFGDRALIAAALFVLLVGIGVWKRSRENLAEAGGLLATIVIAPALVLAATSHPLIYPRYFFIPIGFALLVIADVLTDAWRKGGWPRIAAAVALAAYLAGNGWWTARLLNDGRGDYSGAIAWIAERSPSPVATVSGDLPFIRNGFLFGYYVPRIESAVGKVIYLNPTQVPPQGTDWYIHHNFDGDEPHPESFVDGNGHRYQLDRVFRHASLSGYNWWVYRKTPP